MSHEARVSIFQHWAIHPWRGWWASYGLLILGAGLYALGLEKTALVPMGIGFILWNLSLVQGLRVTWRKSRWKTALIVSLLFVAALSNPIEKAVSTGDMATPRPANRHFL